MLALLYFFIIVFANTIGAISGMGGGVIIKPLLDSIGAHSVAEISFYATVAVFTMSIVSTGNQIKQGLQLKWLMTIWLSFGSILGGILGNASLTYLLSLVATDKWVLLLQIILLILTLVWTLWYSRTEKKTYSYHSKRVYLLVGFLLGFMASFLGIGGGPINVSLLMLCFSLTIKEATVYSICIIFTSQLSKLLTILITPSQFSIDKLLLVAVVLAGFCGGYLGSHLNRAFPNSWVLKVFQLVILGVISLNLFNLVRLLPVLF